jgi:ABC-2 type transport system permease protein
MKAVIKKELADHFGSTRFIIVLSTIFMVSFLITHLTGQSIRGVLAEGGSIYLEGRTFLLLFTATGAFFSFNVFLSLFGPLTGIILGFDAINRERNQGTLSKILAQPIHRDEVILGKYLAGLITISIMTTALILLLSGMGLVGVGVVPTLDEVLRLIAFLILSIMYVGFWLGLSILLSIVFRSVTTSAMAAATLWIFIIFFLPVLGQSLAEAISPITDRSRPDPKEVASYTRINKALTMISPTGLYTESGEILLDPTHRGTDQNFRLAVMSPVDRYLLSRFQGVLSLWQSILLVMPDVLILICFTALTFLLSYVFFVRLEVRSI